MGGSVNANAATIARTRLDRDISMDGSGDCSMASVSARAFMLTRRRKDGENMKRVLITGMSGTGKSAVIQELVSRGYPAHDLDTPEWSEWIDAAPSDGLTPVQGKDWVWREDRVRALLSGPGAATLFISGCAENMSGLFPLIDCIILLVRACRHHPRASRSPLLRRVRPCRGRAAQGGRSHRDGRAAAEESGRPGNRHEEDRCGPRSTRSCKSAERAASPRRSAPRRTAPSIADRSRSSRRDPAPLQLRRRKLPPRQALELLHHLLRRSSAGRDGRSGWHSSAVFLSPFFSVMHIRHGRLAG